MEYYPIQNEMTDTVKDILQNIEQASRMIVTVLEVVGFSSLILWGDGREFKNWRDNKIRYNGCHYKLNIPPGRGLLLEQQIPQ